MTEGESELPPQYQGGDEDRVAIKIKAATTEEEVGQIQDILDLVATDPVKKANWPIERIVKLRASAENKIDELRSQHQTGDTK